MSDNLGTSESKGFDEWYQQAFEGTKVDSFSHTEALSVDNHVQNLTNTSLKTFGGVSNPDQPDALQHDFPPETVYPEVWRTLAFYASLDTHRARAPSPTCGGGQEENLALTEALTDRCQRIVVSLCLPLLMIFLVGLA